MASKRELQARIRVLEEMVGCPARYDWFDEKLPPQGLFKSLQRIYDYLDVELVSQESPVLRKKKSKHE